MKLFSMNLMLRCRKTLLSSENNDIIQNCRRYQHTAGVCNAITMPAYLVKVCSHCRRFCCPNVVEIGANFANNCDLEHTKNFMLSNFSCFTVEQVHSNQACTDIQGTIRNPGDPVDANHHHRIVES
jgi:hypothetical protein